MVRQGFFAGLVFACYCFVLIRTAWLTEDAFITFRVIHNLWDGFGLRWNVHERVQVFTHPLWMMTMAGFYGLTREIYLTPLLVSMAVSVATVWVVAFRVSRDGLSAVVALAALICSKAFMDYSTSGLENPLTHLLLAVFLWHWFLPKHGRKQIALMSFVTGLAILNRMDTALFYAPCMAFLLLRNLCFKTWLLASLGALPLVIWAAFSIAYYGFFFPNTAYAKLNVGVPRIDLLVEGVCHFVSLAQMDPWTLTVLFAALAIALSRPDLKWLLPGLGGVLYLAYFCYVGGDYILGRFFSAPFLLAVCLLSRVSWRPREGILMITLSLCMVLASPYPVILAGKNHGAERRTKPHGHQDVRMRSDQQPLYVGSAGLLNGPGNGWQIQTSGAAKGRRYSRQTRQRVRRHGPLGFRFYFAGPKVTHVDENALTDPLLARLPMEKGNRWRSGHFDRKIPDGYLDSVRKGTNLVKDPHLKEYYRILKIITQGPIWSRERWQLIWGMQSGRYDHLIDAYLER